MKTAKIIWVTPSTVSESALKQAIGCDIDGIRLRCKQLPIDALRKLAQTTRTLTKQAGKSCSINSSVAIAREVGADEVHLPESMLDLCPRIEELSVNVSVHSMEAAIQAQRYGAHALTFGPIFDTPSKRMYGPPQGLTKLKEIVHATSLPVYAIGGITPDRIEICLQCGVYGVMMQSYITEKLTCR